MISAKAPGKLFIAGEYAVVEPGNTAILIAVDKFITVFLEKSTDKGSFSIYDNEPILWERSNEKIILERQSPSLKYILSAADIVERYAKELGRSLSCYHLKVKSDLIAKNGTKYGLGSSGAVTVATISVLSNYYNIVLTKEELFKLSAIASLSINKKSSCGDIAACVYGGWVAYTSFQREWVLDKLESTTVSDVLKLEWPSFKVEPLTPPRELNLAIGWTGSPSSTRNLVSRVSHRKQNNKDIYNRFLNDSKKCVNQMINAFRDNDIDEIQRQIQKNRELLVKLGNDIGVEIETLELKKLCDTALKYNGSAKSSGAGGGDCGIAIFKESNNLDSLIEEWRKVGITYLPLNVYYKKGDYIDK